MARNRITSYLDIAQTWPNITPEGREQLERELEEENKNLTEWPKL